MSSKKHNRTAEEILAHIEQHGVEQKDAAGRGDKRISTKRSRRSKAHRMEIDLHGLRSEEAQQKVRYALERCRSVGTQELLIVHGYGLHSDPTEGPVLKKLVRDLLDYELKMNYRTYRAAAQRDGGDGATLVYVR
jgi:DNA-nicking Smr family endonuclease